MKGFLSPNGQERCANESAMFPPTEKGVAREWLGNPLLLFSTTTALAAPETEAVAVTPGPSRVDSKAVFENGQQGAGSDDELLGRLKGFLDSLTPEEPVGAGAAVKVTPVSPNEGMPCGVIDDDACSGSVSDESGLGPVSVDDTMPPSDSDNGNNTQSTSEEKQTHYRSMEPS